MRALLLGNSQIICNESIPALLRRLAASLAPPAELEVEAVAIGGATIETLWNDGRPLAAVRRGGWDRVLFHEIVASYGGTGERLREFGLRFAHEAAAVGARVVVYASGDVEHQRATHTGMYADALSLARACGGRVAGGGMAWLRAWRERPDLDFHHVDRAHASLRGYYLNAGVILAALTDRSPIGGEAGGLPADDAAFLQRIAAGQSADDRRAEAALAAS
ncbi:MAG TPA: hypothetical protein VEL07_14485 [Planctomycetota bacterium]|nr:hypothetical protein [Planctomycetota bacterium]